MEYLRGRLSERRVAGSGADRADRLIGRLEAFDGNVALFSHGHFSRVLAARWTRLAARGGQRLLLDTGSVSILQDEPRHPETRVILLWNVVRGTR